MQQDLVESRLSVDPRLVDSSPTPHHPPIKAMAQLVELFGCEETNFTIVFAKRRQKRNLDCLSDEAVNLTVNFIGFLEKSPIIF